MLLVNGAGGPGDPVLEDLPIALIGGSDTLDLAQNVRAFIDQASGTGMNEVTSGLSPDPTTVFMAGADGVYTQSTRRLDIGDNTNISPGDFFYADNGITPTLGRVQSLDGAAAVIFDEDIFGADAVGVAYQVHYVYEGAMAETGALRATSAGQINYWKFQGEDSYGNLGSAEDSVHGRLDPSGAAFIEINGGSFIGQRISTFNPTFDILPGWTSRGGILTVQLVDASGMQWWDGTTGEKLLSDMLAQPEDNRLNLVGGDGNKSASLRLRTLRASPVYRDVAISVSVDSSPPNITLSASGR